MNEMRNEAQKYAVRPTADGYVPQADPPGSVIVTFSSLDAALAECQRLNKIQSRPVSRATRQKMVDYVDDDESAQR